MAMVFISYSSQDKLITDKIVDELKSNHIDCEYLPSGAIPPGDGKQKFIEKRIRRCELVLVVVSENSLMSEWVEFEMMMAVKHEKRIIPFFIDGKRFETGLPIVLRGLAGLNQVEQLIELLVDIKSSLTRMILGPFPTGYKTLLTIYLGLLLGGAVGGKKLVAIPVGDLCVVPFGVGVISFTIVLFISDVVHEIYGEYAAKCLVLPGVIALMLMSLCLILFLFLPAPNVQDWDKLAEEAYGITLWGAIFVTGWGTIAYVITQSFDIYVFQKLTQKWGYVNGGRRSFIATLCAQFINTLFYIPLVYGTYGKMFTDIEFGLLFGHFALKSSISFIATCFFKPIVHYFTPKNPLRFNISEE